MSLNLYIPKLNLCAHSTAYPVHPASGFLSLSYGLYICIRIIVLCLCIYVYTRLGLLYLMVADLGPMAIEDQERKWEVKSQYECTLLGFLRERSKFDGGRQT
jgi:hypothetical protein